jgi:hypothetical protein
MANFKIGSDASNHLAVAIDGRPDERDDWLTATISVRVGAFTGTTDATLLTSDFPRFRTQLESLYKTLSGIALFETIEGQLRINLAGNERGGIAVEGRVQDRVGDGNELIFRFDIDQTYLPQIIRDLLMIESEFPNKIHPSYPQ